MLEWKAVEEAKTSSSKVILPPTKDYYVYVNQGCNVTIKNNIYSSSLEGRTGYDGSNMYKNQLRFLLYTNTSYTLSNDNFFVIEGNEIRNFRSSGTLHGVFGTTVDTVWNLIIKNNTFVYSQNPDSTEGTGRFLNSAGDMQDEYVPTRNG